MNIHGKIIQLYSGEESEGEMIYTSLQKERSATLSVKTISVPGCGSSKGVSHHKTLRTWDVSGSLILSSSQVLALVASMSSDNIFYLQFGGEAENGDTYYKYYRGEAYITTFGYSAQGNGLVFVNITFQGTGPVVNYTP